MDFKKNLFNVHRDKCGNIHSSIKIRTQYTILQKRFITKFSKTASG